MAGHVNLPSMAWRNLWRNRRRTLLTLSAFAFGVLLAVIFTGMGDSVYGSMIDLAARMGAGHVTYQHPEYQETPSLKRTVTNTSSLEKAALADPEVDRVVTRVAGATMLATANNSYGAFFLAIDPEQEDEDTLSVMDGISEGEMFESSDDKGIILGAVLADNLGTKLGRKVVFTMTDRDGEIVSGLARVRGIVKTGAPSVDGGLALMPIGLVRDTIGYAPDEATQVAVFIKDNRESQAVADRLGAKVGDDVAVLTWQKTQPDLATYIATDSAGLVVFELIIMVLLAAGIFNALFVSVMERLREFGIMMAIGFSPRQLFALVMWESLWLSLVGLVVAAIVTVGPYYYLNTVGIDFSELLGGEGGPEISGVAIDPIMYVAIYPESLAVIAVIVVLATLVSGLYPAWKAGRVAPVETIKLV
jgi:ABC-type lipoprotein release transport system permease subunit